MLRLQKTTLQITTLFICCVVIPTVAIRSLVSVPASNGGVLTAGIGQQISLTCSHEDASAATVWRIRAPVDCTTGIIHTIAPSGIVDCGPFSFINVTQGTSAPFTSTAVANATTSMTGAVVQCFSGTGDSTVQVGPNITLCVYDNPPPPDNLQCQSMSDGVVEISWSPVPQDCTMSSVYYRINITSIDGNMTEEILFNTTGTSGQFSLNVAQDYVATITAVIIDPTMRISEGTLCTFTAEEVVVTTVFSTTSHVRISTTDQRNRANLGTVSTTTIAVIITLSLIFTIIVIVGVVFGSLATFHIMKKRKSTPEHHSPTDGASGGPFYEQVSPPNTSTQDVKMDKNVAYGLVQR